MCITNVNLYIHVLYNVTPLMATIGNAKAPDVEKRKTLDLVGSFPICFWVTYCKLCTASQWDVNVNHINNPVRIATYDCRLVQFLERGVFSKAPETSTS